MHKFRFCLPPSILFILPWTFIMTFLLHTTESYRTCTVWYCTCFSYVHEIYSSILLAYAHNDGSARREAATRVIMAPLDRMLSTVWAILRADDGNGCDAKNCSISSAWASVQWRHNAKTMTASIREGFALASLFWINCRFWGIQQGTTYHVSWANACKYNYILFYLSPAAHNSKQTATQQH